MARRSRSSSFLADGDGAEETKTSGGQVDGEVPEDRHGRSAERGCQGAVAARQVPPPKSAEDHDANERQGDHHACRREPPSASATRFALGVEALELGPRPCVLRVEGQSLLERLGVRDPVRQQIFALEVVDLTAEVARIRGRPRRA